MGRRIAPVKRCRRAMAEPVWTAVNNATETRHEQAGLCVFAGESASRRLEPRQQDEVVIMSVSHVVLFCRPEIKAHKPLSG